MNAYEMNAQFIINERWLFDTSESTLSDLAGRCSKTPLQPTAARVLAVLARSAQTIVRRRQLFDEGWRQYGFEVCENCLNQVVHTLRQVFFTLEPGRTTIKTIPRIGYCLLADVREQSPEKVAQRVGDSALPPSERLITRATFDALLERYWQHARQTSIPFSIILLAADCNKAVKSAESGSTDAVLALMINNIPAQLGRAGDHVARYDDESVAILLSNTDRAGAAHLAQKIARVLNEICLKLRTANSTPPRVVMSVASAAGTAYSSTSEFVDGTRAVLDRARAGAVASHTKAPTRSSDIDLSVAAQTCSV